MPPVHTEAATLQQVPTGEARYAARGAAGFGLGLDLGAARLDWV